MDYYPFPATDEEIAIKKDDETGVIESRYRASLYKPFNPTLDPLKLTINLRIDLRQAEPQTFFYDDSDGVTHFATRWKPDDWANFLDAVKQQADRWNDRIWLKPPPLFDDYDIADPRPPGRVWRSNIACALEVDWNAKINPHKVVTAVRLDDVLEQLAEKPRFRNDSGLYSSNMEEPRLNFRDSHFKAAWQTVVTHELGHLLGLGHIGVIMDLKNCRLARGLAKRGFNLPGTDFEGGAGSNVCYGFDEAAAIALDVMGMGTAITQRDALPWMRAMSELSPTSGSAGGWTPVIRNPGPGVWRAR